MKSWLRSFNIYLFAAAVFLAAGCGTHRLDKSKEYTFLRVFLEVHDGADTHAQMTRVARIPIYVESEPFLTEVDVSRAALVDFPDGTYAVQVMFNEHGSLLLDMTSTSNKGLNLVVSLLFPPPGGKEPKNREAPSVEKEVPGQPRVSSWSAVRITRNISNGTIQFTPDTTHAEAERIVRGLNNMVAEIEKMER
jgi:hypothetical protein